MMTEPQLVKQQTRVPVEGYRRAILDDKHATKRHFTSCRQPAERDILAFTVCCQGPDLPVSSRYGIIFRNCEQFWQRDGRVGVSWLLWRSCTRRLQLLAMQSQTRHPCLADSSGDQPMRKRVTTRTAYCMTAGSPERCLHGTHILCIDACPSAVFSSHPAAQLQSYT